MDYCSPEKRNNTHCIKNKSNFTQLSELELTNIIKKNLNIIAIINLL